MQDIIKIKAKSSKLLLFKDLTDIIKGSFIKQFERKEFTCLLKSVVRSMIEL